MHKAALWTPNACLSELGDLEYIRREFISSTVLLHCENKVCNYFVIGLEFVVFIR
jgi:hypothetical protein